MDKNLKDLAYLAARRLPSENFTAEDVNEAFRAELNKACGSIASFMKNRYDLYELIGENADEVSLNKTIETIGRFAEVRQVAQNQKVFFKTSRTLAKLRARKFITRVGLSGVYETFRLDRDTFEVPTFAVGGAATLDYERMMDNEETLADVMDVISDGITDATFIEVQKALTSAVNNGLPAANKVIANSFQADQMVKLCRIAKAYGGGGCAIFATPEFITAMGPDAVVPAIANAAQGIYSPEDIADIHNKGLITLFRGVPVIELPQSFIDRNNVKTWLNPQFAYIMPTGNEKVVKVVYEGNTQVNDHKNADNSIEIHAYKKLGVAIQTYYCFCVYQNGNIPDTSADPYGF